MHRLGVEVPRRQRRTGRRLADRCRCARLRWTAGEWPMTAVLRPHQEQLLQQIDETITSGCRRVVAQAPTGFGKTIVGAHRLRLLQDAGKRALFIVPALSLIDQTIEKLYAEDVRDV